MSVNAHLNDAPARAVLADGTELHYVEMGQGPTVILLHGGMGDCCSWAAQVDALAPRFRAISYSRRNNSPNRNPLPTTGHSIDIDVADLLAFQHLLGIGQAHLVATSYGALLALAFALEHPTRVSSLVLAEPPLHLWARRTRSGAELYAAFMRNVWRPAAQAFEVGDERRALQLLADGIWGRPIFDALPPQRMAMLLRNAGSMRALTQLLDPFPDLSRTALGNLAIPALLVHGEHASELHLCVIDELARVIQGAARAVVTHAGHGSPQDNPSGFSEAVLDFLGDLERTRPTLGAVS